MRQLRTTGQTPAARGLPGMSATTSAAVALACALAWNMAAGAESPDPTMHQIYQAAEAGHLDQAQQMMDQVLRDHPRSGKAHYVQAELYAKEGKTSLARSELAQAEQFDPGLTHENPASVRALRAQLGLAPSLGMRSAAGAESPVAAHFPWLTVLILGTAIGGLWLLFRRRSANTPGYPSSAGVPTGPAVSGYGTAPGPGPGGGLGSGIVGGLASGLAVGAGVVAGEELARHFLDGGRGDGADILPQAHAAEAARSEDNADLGGSDFGVNDNSGWDDAGDTGGGDDW